MYERAGTQEQAVEGRQGGKKMEQAAPGRRTRTEGLRPMQAKRTDPARDVDPATLPAGGGGVQLPEGLRSKMESALGADFSAVRVHVGPAAAAVGARAYTQGDDIHFAPGQYDPASESGQQLLGHELAHVVQQRAGRVTAPTQAKDGGAMGAPINADASLEAEADAVGAKAARGEIAFGAEKVSGGGGAGGGGAGTGHGSASGAGGAVIQRAVGFEFELGSWDSRNTAENRRLAKGEKIARHDGFNIEGEDAGATSAVEFVTKPLATLGEIEGAIGAAQEIAQGMFSRKPTLTAELYGGSKDVTITPGEAKAKMQASPAIALDNIGDLYTHKTVQVSNPKALVGKVRSVLGESSTKELLGSKDAPKDPSKAMEGLLILIVDYILQGMSKAERSYPKSAFNIMARTSFTKMFNLIPEHEFFAHKDNLDKWVGLVMKIVDSFPFPEQMKGKDQPVLNNVFTGMESVPDDKGVVPGGEHAYTLNTTREQWLKAMPEKDLLAKAQDKRFEGMGAYDDATDKLVEEGVKLGVGELVKSTPPEELGVGVDEDAPESDQQQGEVEAPKEDGPPKEAPLFELRGQRDLFGIDQEVGLGQWLNKAKEIYAIVHDVNKGASYGAKKSGHGVAPDVDDRGAWTETAMPVRPQATPQPVAPQVAPEVAPSKGSKKKLKKPAKKKWRWPFSKLFS